MILLFFKMVLRGILKNKVHSLINVLGFSIGIATTLFIFLFLRYETSYDDFHKDSNRLYRVTQSYVNKGQVTKVGFCFYPLAKDVKNEIPGVDDFCRISDASPIKCYVQNQLQVVEKFRFADENIFTFFGFRLIEGNPKTVLNSAEMVVLSQKEAVKLFGDKNPLGQTIMYGKIPFTVSGIVADLPSNTHLQFDMLASTKYIEQNTAEFHPGYNGGITLLSYLKLSKRITAGQIEARLPDFLYQKVNKYWERSGMKLTSSLQNIQDVHLNSNNDYDCGSNRTKNNLYIVSSICLLILVLAVVNYIILYVAQKAGKIKDISLLKVHGAGKYKLALLTFIEVLIFSVFASIAGILLLCLILPFLNNQLQTSVVIAGNLVPALAFLVLTILTLSLLIAVLSNCSIFNIKTIDALKGTDNGNHKNLLGNSLITFQFAVVIVLIVSVLFIGRQNSFILNKELGFSKSNVLLLSSDQRFKNNELFRFKQELKTIPGISSVCLTSQSVGSGLTKNGYTLGNEKDVSMINALYVDADFLDFFNIPLISGRNFNADITKEQTSVIVNRKLVEKANWNEPLNQFINRNGQLKVIGTIGDFNFAPLQMDIQPLIISVSPANDGWGYGYVNIRYQTSDIQSLIKKISKLWDNNFPSVPYELSFLDDQLEKNYESLKAQQKIVTFFSGLSILIACMGLFGLTIFVTRNRTKEIGVRKVNGARVSEILTMLNKDFVKWVAIAFVIATPVAWYAVQKWLEDFAYKTDLAWWIFALAGLMALGIALLTVSWQSWKAASSNPVEALRHE